MGSEQKRYAPLPATMGSLWLVLLRLEIGGVIIVIEDTILFYSIELRMDMKKATVILAFCMLLILTCALTVISVSAETEIERLELLGTFDIEAGMAVPDDIRAPEAAEGDLDADGVITNSDITLFVRYLCGWANSIETSIL